MYQFFWIFFIYAFLGWCTEVSYAALNTGRFINRGFLNGPVCPIYGFGIVIVLACLTPLKYNFFLLFLGSVVLTSALELITGFVLEKIFHQRWWDYSEKPFNLRGYVCLQFSVLWGLACVFVVDILHPSIEFLIRIIPLTLGWVLLGLFAAVMAVDLAATVRTIAKINRQLSQIDELASKIKEASNEFGETLADKVLDAAEKGSDLKGDLDCFVGALANRKEGLEDALSVKKSELQENLGDFLESLDERKAKLETLLDKAAFGQRRLMDAFPRMRSTDHKQALDRLRRRMNLRRGQRGK
ncbi:MAG: hypothetical protein AB7E30_10225 [Lawsonibacter sp.]